VGELLSPKKTKPRTEDFFWDHLEENVLLLKNLKGILFYYHGPPRIQYITKTFLENNSYFTPQPDLWIKRFEFLECQGIKMLNSFQELDSKIDMLSGNVRFDFNF
jgi:hypothetical protein